MNLHEYQAKALFRDYGIPVPESRVADSVDSAVAAAAAVGGTQWMIKAQVHAGGRGKAGGVIHCTTLDEVRNAAGQLLGRPLVTAQSGGRALPVERVLIEAPASATQEFYLAMLVDRAAERVMLIASRAGGGDVEAAAAAKPAAFERVWVHPATGLRAWQSRHLGYRLGLPAATLKPLHQITQALYRLFIDKDASLLEINPLALGAGDQLLALDAKVVLDANALYRHPDLQALRDRSQEDEREARADKQGLSYVSLDGNIGCMVNGAGLAMATMDLVQRHGGKPANFLDVGGNTTAERVAEAFQLILSDAKVGAILVNIFGGIVRCDLIAEGIIQAVARTALRVPLVVRLAGTNAEQGLAMLAQSGLALETASDLAEAADRVVAAATRPINLDT
ncbi:ADP-forming succinate--CoA ligase subunit beta [Thiorhodovibrio frisius]|uniref:Succinate--CoA ligase [ADP-forming] subunit beta n=1 Tax=Thiorhodovibrio frisius TaxID=631362 RepID=H8YZY4_9GAMM|nr:ADP-forming succinate--CoA ligase subunit beta [Thiorhodovibrio frisius]EIC22261.1 succinyl-CoA synthetase, beta subunit [Thiorhodovibrio frisius]WPL24556.1 Succinyl-CoA ligase [ADP-forming] subunit beta [Thiorhodovibrio frisius]